MKVLLLTPPLTQLNTPYPATAYLTGFLRHQGYQAVQDDLSIRLVTTLFSSHGLKRIQKALRDAGQDVVAFFHENANAYISVIDSVIRFLQGKDSSLALRINTRNFLPEGPYFKKNIEALESRDYLDFAFGTLGSQDRAKYFASLMLSELSEVVRLGIDSRFELSRYAEKLSASQASYTPIESALKEKTLVDDMLTELTLQTLEREKPNVVGITVPFPGNLLGALRIAESIKSKYPQVKVVLGGGYPNTELRSLEDSRIFTNIDAIVLDDGEQPFLRLLEYFEGKRNKQELLRTFFKAGSKVEFLTNTQVHDVPFGERGVPTYDGLPLDQYLSILEMLNPAHRLCSDTRWNKVTLAHGCYWKKCSFCDVSLDYIGRYEPGRVDEILNRMQSLANETGVSGFHFVDEAAPPVLLKALSERILERGLTFSWWGNLRFDKAFTPELARLMAKAGCIAVTGGLEVASDRLLKLMQKGVTIDQVARVTKAFNDAGILVHAYLMYGFPTQTVQETVDSLEVVRQLFKFGCLDSAYWHRFSATVHSPIGKSPKEYGIEINPMTRKEPLFAMNDLDFVDSTNTDHQTLGTGLKKALYNYMHGIGLEEDVRVWFENEIPKSMIAKSRIETALGEK